MSASYNVRDAKARLSELLDLAASGQPVEILRQGAKRGRFRIVLVEEGGRLRRPGALRGRLTLPDDFDDEDEAITAAFEGRGD